MKQTPPDLARKFLLLFLRDSLAEEVLGDLDEKFHELIRTRTLLRARLNYWYEVINYLRPFAMKKILRFTRGGNGMLGNYLKISTRTLLKQKLYSFINIGGLAIGLACFIMMMVYVQHEFSYNNFYPNKERLYRVYQKQEGNVYLGSEYFSATPAKLASVMREEFPEVEYASSVEQTSGLIEFEDKAFFERGLAGDEQVFDVFPLTFVSGSPSAFADPKGIVLTETLARTIFGDDEAVGKILRYQDRDGFKITGVVKDAPTNSSIKYSFIININYNDYWVEEQKNTSWTGNSGSTFFQLAAGADPRLLESKFPALLDKYRNAKAYKDYPFKDIYFVQPIEEMYFQPGVHFDIGLKGNRNVVYLYAGVGLIVLLLACVNYMNLAIARSIRRFREVGIRKAVGAARRQLVVQFLGESLFIAFISLAIGLVLAYLLLPYFSALIDRPIEVDFFANPYLVPLLLVLVLAVGFLSGCYPAFVMSSLKPIGVLKVKSDVKLSGFSLQRVLIVVQFAASITLIVCSLVIYRQLEYIRNKEVGYEKKNIVTVRLQDRSLIGKFQVLANDLNQNSQVIASTISTDLPINVLSSTMMKRTVDDDDPTAIYRLTVGYDFVRLYDLQMVTGRNFSRDISTDTDERYIINETAVKALGWSPHEAVGKQFFQGNDPKTVIGVIKDFHIHSMHQQIMPLMISVSESRGRFVSIRVKPDNMVETISSIEKSFRKVSLYPFQYDFVEDQYNRLYESEQKLGEIFKFFTVVSILIAALGLFGLAVFFADQKTKEIGIRKVLGAGVGDIVLLLSKNFMLLILVSFLISVPIGWKAMDLWLESFAFRISLEWWMFAGAGLLALLVAKISIGYQSLKASVSNPVDSLRSE